MKAPRVQSTRLESLDAVCLQPAKAEMRVNRDQSPLRVVVSEVIRRVTSQKAAALDMGIDQGQLSRQLQTGRITIERLETLGPLYAAELGRALNEQYGAAIESRQARAQRVIPELIRELLEGIA
jgi:hypothetical protein